MRVYIHASGVRVDTHVYTYAEFIRRREGRPSSHPSHLCITIHFFRDFSPPLWYPATSPLLLAQPDSPPYDGSSFVPYYAQTSKHALRVLRRDTLHRIYRNFFTEVTSQSEGKRRLAKGRYTATKTSDKFREHRVVSNVR